MGLEEDLFEHFESTDADRVPGTATRRPRFPLNDSVPARLLDLLVATTDLTELLTAVAGMAAETIPGCVSASITVICRGRPATIGYSDWRAVTVDHAQYLAGKGPCIDAVYGEDVARMEDVDPAADEGSWCHAAAAIGFTSAFSVSIRSAANIAAALNLYTGRTTGWPPRTVIAADALVTCAGDAITLIHRMTLHDTPRRYPWSLLR